MIWFWIGCYTATAPEMPPARLRLSRIRTEYVHGHRRAAANEGSAAI